VLVVGSLVGADGLVVGFVVGVGIARFAGRKSRAGWIAAAILVAVLVGAGIWFVTSVRTVPKNSADARAHDYSLAGLWVAMGIWMTLVNALGAVVGVRLPIRRRRRRATLSPGDARNSPES
jgi:mannose/fructose/N-acetylgalactosamine-specific phosphotransferase system component IIC